MIYDLHVHVIDAGTRRTHPRNPVLRRIARHLGAPADAGQRALDWLNASVVGRAVFLALDAAHDDEGRHDDARTAHATNNDAVADLADANPKVLFGASVHPYRPDALRELDRLAARGACLVKWLPSAQNIAPDDPRCLPFYEALAHHRLPLLCHTGNEHTLRGFPNALNRPARLVPALKRGVTVIAAHCGARLFLHERSYAREWRRLALEHERMYGDISAFGVATRIWSLRRMLASPELTAKLVFGSDFPVPPAPWTCLGCLGPRAALRAQRMTNPFDQAVAIMRSAGVPDAVFARAGSLLRTGDQS